MQKTVDWYINNMTWVNNIVSGTYRNWLEQNYANRGQA